MENADLGATLTGGVLTAQRLTGNIFGGRLTGNARIDANRGPSLDTAITLENLDVARAARAIGETGAASGRMGMNMTLDTAGGSVANMVSAFNGSGSFALRDLDVKSGTKGTALAGPLNLISGLGALGGGARPGKLATVTGSFVMDRGVARSQDLALDSGYGTGVASGVFDLPNWRMEVKGRIDLAQGLHTALASKIREIPSSLPLLLRGPLDNPKVIEPDIKTILGRQVVIPGVQKLIQKKLLKGDKGNVLQQLLPGLLGAPPAPQQAPAQPQSQPQPQPQSSGGLLPPPPPPGTTPQPQQQQKAPSPQDLLRQLLKIN